MSGSLLAVAAHPDDLEFGCGGILLKEANRPQHWLIGSRGEAGSNGSPAERQAESERAAAMVGADLHWEDLGGDAQMQMSTANALKLAGWIRKLQPTYVLAPTLEENQHPDHTRVARLVREAARLARYAGLEPLADLPAHSISALLYYRVTSASPSGTCILVDVSQQLERWKALMACHQSQLKTRNYIEYQLTYARLMGLECGVDYALPLFAEEGLLVPGLEAIENSARRF